MVAVALIVLLVCEHFLIFYKLAYFVSVFVGGSVSYELWDSEPLCSGHHGFSPGRGPFEQMCALDLPGCGLQPEPGVLPQPGSEPAAHVAVVLAGHSPESQKRNPKAIGGGMSFPQTSGKYGGLLRKPSGKTMTATDLKGNHGAP